MYNMILFFDLFITSFGLNSLIKTAKFDMSVLENTKGIPEFWLTAMKNVETIAEMIQVDVFFSMVTRL